MNIRLDQIRIDGGTQTRAKIREEVVEEYAEAIAEGVKLPAAVVFHDGKDYWLGDGFHRYHSYRKAGKNSMPCDVQQGTRRDALLYAAGANAEHGLRRTKDDKREAVRLLLADPEWATRSDRWIAEACKVSHPFVAGVRGQLVTLPVVRGEPAPVEQPETRTGQDGKERPASKPAPTPPESKLIPELRCRPWSPRFLPLVEVLDVATQYAFNARLNEGKTPAVALAEVTEQIKQPEPPAPKPTPKPAKAEREPGDDTEAERADELYIAERILASCAEDEQAGDCTLTKHQAGLITAELARLRKNQRKGPAPKFTPPTLEEVKAYCRERKNKVDAQAFVDFYQSKGWLVGRVPMKDWRAAVRTWERNEYGTNGKGADFYAGIREFVERGEHDES